MIPMVAVAGRLTRPLDSSIAAFRQDALDTGCAPLGLWFTDAPSVFRSLTPDCKKSPPSHTHYRGWDARADRKVTLALVADEAARN